MTSFGAHLPAEGSMPPFTGATTWLAAELRWAKNDAAPTGAVNEAESIQLKDTGHFHRLLCPTPGHQEGSLLVAAKPLARATLEPQ